MSARAPDFFIVGHHKSGTTALYEMLRRHPQIYMPDLKEPRFLASELASPRQTTRRTSHPQTLQEYLALFEAAAPEQRVGEASATYLWSRTAAGRIAELEPGARIIAILREPASFLRSLHLTYLRIHFEDEKDLRKAMSLESARREGKRIPPRSHLPALLQYSDQVRYVEQLARYRKAFAPEQMLVLIYDDFRNDNETTVRSVLRFLEVDDGQSLQPIHANVTSWSVRSQQTEDLLRSVALGRGACSRSPRRRRKPSQRAGSVKRGDARDPPQCRSRRASAARSGAHAGASASLQARGGCVERVSRERSAALRGYDASRTRGSSSRSPQSVTHRRGPVESISSYRSPASAISNPH